VSALVLDAGALIAVDSGDRRVVALLARARERGIRLRSNPMVVAQAWRDGARQAELAKLLQAVDVVTIDESAGRRAGELLAAAGRLDAVDASVVVLAASGDSILTSDPADIRDLLAAGGRRADVITC
jgi:predicted nucleic acid-binding protein